jgi:branched-chain amino acid transport system ATP-binding protein
MLEVENIHAYYGDSHVLRGLSFEIGEGEVIAVLGRNGAGKTTTVLTLMGYVTPRQGRVTYRRRNLTGWRPHRIVRAGFGFVPQERCIFPSLTVEENLTVAGRGRAGMRWDLTAVYGLFPRLRERRRNLGFQLSGGEQQMLSIARALMTNPSLLLLDEPSEGLAPMVVQEVLQAIRVLKQEGLAILLVEQNLPAALAVADRHIVLGKGQIVFAGTTGEIDGNEAVLKTHLSI